MRIGAYPTRKGPEKSPFVASILRKNDPLHNLDGGLSLYYSKGTSRDILMISYDLQFHQ